MHPIPYGWTLGVDWEIGRSPEMQAHDTLAQQVSRLTVMETVAPLVAHKSVVLCTTFLQYAPSGTGDIAGPKTACAVASGEGQHVDFECSVTVELVLEKDAEQLFKRSSVGSESRASKISMDTKSHVPSCSS